MDENQKMDAEEPTSTDAAATDAGGGSEGSAATQEPGQELLNELSVLADRFVNVVRVAWDSDQRKKIETDLRAGLDSLSHSLEEGFHQVASSEEAKQLQSKADEVSHKVTTSELFADLARTMKTGLQALSEQLEKAAEDLEKKQKAGSPAPSAEQPAEEKADPATKDIPIDKT